MTVRIALARRLQRLSVISFAALVGTALLVGCDERDKEGANAVAGKLYFSYGKMHELDMASGEMVDYGYGSLPWPLANGEFIYVTQLDKLVRGDREGVTATEIVDCPYCDRVALNEDESLLVHCTLDEIEGESNNWTAVRQLDGTVVAHWADMWAPAFMPDGRVVMTGSLGEQQGIYVAALDDAVPTKIDNLVNQPTDAAPSPDGQRIAFAYQGHVWTIAVDGSDPTQITGDELYLGASWPTWSPDGQNIAFQHGSYVWFVPADGSGPAQPIINPVGNEWLAEGPMVWR